jgi:hypothetical protein
MAVSQFVRDMSIVHIGGENPNCEDDYRETYVGAF